MLKKASRSASAPSTQENAHPYPAFPIVGIGASAGGLEAFTELLTHLPIDTGMAFVLIQHLDPHHESALTQLLGMATRMQVCEVKEKMRLEANRVYVIPPNKNLSVVKGVLRLTARPKPPILHRSIDFFFEALAHDQRERAIGVILSGTATDGTMGLQAIKSEGGIAFAQDNSAKYDSMPRSAVAAGCVDFVLSPENIAIELARIAKHPYVTGHQEDILSVPQGRPAPAALPGKDGTLQSPKEKRSVGGSFTPTEAEPGPERQAAESGFRKVLLLLRNHTGVDFLLYKSTTILRRIARRMVLNRQDTLENYAEFLRNNTKELDCLYSDVLIGVTSFFRNPDAFDILKRTVFPKLLQQGGDDPFRVWVLGCSTGQEAYSIAIAFVEAAEKAPHMRKLQVFATDINDAFLDKARNGLYPKSIADEMSPERLLRFFVEEEGGYRIIKSLREMVVFARQNLINDPPFSRMDLISCRNLLIYLEPSLQKKVLPTFHYALKPGGFLLLGASESIGGFGNLFQATDKKHKIYSKKPAATQLFQLPIKKDHVSQRSELTSNRVLAIEEAEASDSFRGEFNAQREADRITVNQFAPPGVLVNADLQILQFRGSTSAYLEPPTGKVSFNLLKMAQKGLMLPLRAAINKAAKENKTVHKQNVRVEQHGTTRIVNLEVIPLKNLRERCFLILFEDAARAKMADSKRSARSGVKSKRPATVEDPNCIADLESELSETRDYLQSIQEQNDASSEELQTANEEIQSANEELQSINEELETSKEELESTNEELITVNEEMANRNAELNLLSSDLLNLQTSTRLSIVLLGRDLTIRRFSTQAEKQFDMISSDIGRPIRHVQHNLVFETPCPVTTSIPEASVRATASRRPEANQAPHDLESFVAQVIADVRERECEVRDGTGHWYSLRVRPYFTTDNQVDGAVLVLVDIDALKRSEQAIAASRDYAEAIVRTVRDPILILNGDLRIHTANEAFYIRFKMVPEEAEGRLIFELGNGQWKAPKLRTLLEDILPRNSFFDNYELTCDFDRIGRRTMLLNARALNASASEGRNILVGIQDITELLQFQAEMRYSELRYRRLFEAAKEGVLIIDPATRRIVDANPFMSTLLEMPHEELVGKELFEIGLLKDKAASVAALQTLQKELSLHIDRFQVHTRSGKRRQVEIMANRYLENNQPVIQYHIRDVTRRTLAEQQLSEKARLLDLSNDAIIVRDLNDNITLWNKGAEKLYGWTYQEVLGKRLHTLLQTEFPKPMPEIVAQLHRDGQFSGEVVQIARDKRRVSSLCRWVLDHDTQSILTSYTDITERNEATKQMRISEIRYRRLFESAHDGVLILDSVSRKVTDANPFSAQVLGCVREDILHKELWELGLLKDEAASHAMFRDLQSGLTVRYEVIPLKIKGGEKRSVEIVATRYAENGVQVIQCNIRDITERKQAEQAEHINAKCTPPLSA